MSAGKGDLKRPYEPKKWDDGYSGIDFSKRAEGAPPYGTFAPKKETAELQFLEAEEERRHRWPFRKVICGDCATYWAQHGPVTEEHARTSPSIRRWAGDDELVVDRERIAKAPPPNAQ